jgi:hypothetical protein
MSVSTDKNHKVLSYSFVNHWMFGKMDKKTSIKLDREGK